MERFLTGTPAAARRPAAAEPIVDTFDSAVAAGVIEIQKNSVVCLCEPGKKHAVGWGRLSRSRR